MTGREYLEKLTDRELVHSIRYNVSDQGLDTLHQQYITLASFLAGAFTWSETEQGRGYWSEICNDMSRNPKDYYTNKEFTKHKEKLNI